MTAAAAAAAIVERSCQWGATYRRAHATALGTQDLDDPCRSVMGSRQPRRWQQSTPGSPPGTRWRARASVVSAIQHSSAPLWSRPGLLLLLATQQKTPLPSTLAAGDAACRGQATSSAKQGANSTRCSRAAAELAAVVRRCRATRDGLAASTVPASARPGPQSCPAPPAAGRPGHQGGGPAASPAGHPMPQLALGSQVWPCQCRWPQAAGSHGGPQHPSWRCPPAGRPLASSCRMEAQQPAC